VNLLIQKIHPAAVVPAYAHPDDSGLDLFAVEPCVIERGKTALVKTGIKIQLPPNTEAQVRPRSGLALKHGLTVLNTPGTIDEGYRGEICVIMINHGPEDFPVEVGAKIAQLVIAPVLRPQITLADSLDETQRGEMGFGSTGR
jgi:dUTP pyrophosphatase